MSPKQQAARRHNGLLGHTAMMRQQAMSIMQSPTTSQRAKDLAGQVLCTAGELGQELRAVRIDPE